MRKPILNEREATHGQFSDVSRVAQKIKAVYAERGYRHLPDVQMEALDMIASKIARILCGDSDFPDHWKDISGYAELVVESLQPEAIDQ